MYPYIIDSYEYVRYIIVNLVYVFNICSVYIVLLFISFTCTYIIHLQYIAR